MSLVDKLREYRTTKFESGDIYSHHVDRFCPVYMVVGLILGCICFAMKAPLFALGINLLITGVQLLLMSYGTKINRMYNKISNRIFTGNLYEIFDKECVYTEKVLHIRKDAIKRHVQKYKGLKISYIISLDGEIEASKSFKEWSSNTLRAYQDIYYASKSVAESKPLIEDEKERAAIFHRMEILYNSEKTLPVKSSNIAYSVLIVMLITVLSGSFSRLGMDFLSVINEAKYSVLMICSLLLLTYTLTKVHYFKVSEKSLYDLFDMSCSNTTDIIRINAGNILMHYRTHGGYCQWKIKEIKAAIKNAQEKTANKVFAQENESILIAANTKLGSLLSDINKI